jgi:hypothetical protein
MPDEYDEIETNDRDDYLEAMYVEYWAEYHDTMLKLAGGAYDA